MTQNTTIKVKVKTANRPPLSEVNFVVEGIAMSVLTSLKISNRENLIIKPPRDRAEKSRNPPGFLVPSFTLMLTTG